MNLELVKTQSVNDEIKNLSDKDLISRVTSFVRQERQIIEGLIWHLQEVQERKLYISLRYTSLHECLVKHFGYSGAAAYAKISALKIISAVPEAAQALNQGVGRPSGAHDARTRQRRAPTEPWMAWRLKT